MARDESTGSLADQAAAWVPPWSRRAEPAEPQQDADQPEPVVSAPPDEPVTTYDKTSEVEPAEPGAEPAEDSGRAVVAEPAVVADSAIDAEPAAVAAERAAVGPEPAEPDAVAEP